MSWGTYGLDAINGASHVNISSEYACYQNCAAVNPINGTLGGWNYYNNYYCDCKINVPMVYPTLFVHAGSNTSTTLVGSCAMYSSSPCKFVIYFRISIILR